MRDTTYGVQVIFESHMFDKPNVRTGRFCNLSDYGWHHIPEWAIEDLHPQPWDEYQ